MTGCAATITFGTTEIPQGVAKITAKTLYDSDSSAIVVLEKSAVHDVPVDYSDEVRIFTLDEVGARDALFTGFVHEVSEEGEHITVHLRSSIGLLDETVTGGLAVSGHTPAPELFWALMRMAGYGEDRMQIDEFSHGPLEMFLVSVPLDGLNLKEDLRLGPVHILFGDDHFNVPSTLDLRELRKRYFSADAWAVTYVSARTLWEAEVAGLRSIDLAIGWLSMQAKFSSSVLPQREPRAYQRKWTRTRIARRDVVAVWGLSTQRRWLRAPDVPDLKPLDPSEFPDFRDLELPDMLSETIHSGIAAWLRSVRSADPLESVVALWEAIEFYSADASYEKLFSKTEIKQLRARASEGLSPEQAAKLSNVLGMVNSPSLMENFRIAVSSDQVLISREEIGLLVDLRKIRNDLVHGRPATPPTDWQLAHAQSLVNRLYVYRISRLSLFGELESSVSIGDDIRRSLAESKDN